MYRVRPPARHLRLAPVATYIRHPSSARVHPHNTAMILYAVLLCVAFVVWKIGRTVRSSLEKLPGPPAASFFAGMLLLLSYFDVILIVCVGNALELMDRHGWGFHERLMRTYGSVTKLHWLFGVRNLSSQSSAS